MWHRAMKKLTLVLLILALVSTSLVYNLFGVSPLADIIVKVPSGSSRVLPGAPTASQVVNPSPVVPLPPLSDLANDSLGAFKFDRTTLSSDAGPFKFNRTTLSSEADHFRVDWGTLSSDEGPFRFNRTTLSSDEGPFRLNRTTLSSDEAPLRFNWTTCPQCLRPAVPNMIKDGFSEVTDDNLNDKQALEYFTLRPTVVQALVTDLPLVPELVCSDVYLLAVQPSILDRRQERDTVRATWGSVAREQKWPNRKINAKVKVIFVVADQLSATGGKDNSGEPFQPPGNIIAEARENNDILYVRMIDSYASLTLKMLSAFKWVKDNCPYVKFVLKVDYDTFVNVPLLVDTLLYFENRFNFSILGNAYFLNTVRRRSVWAVPKNVFPLSLYPTHASGCGYVLSYSALTQIVDAAPHFRFLSVEDAFITGILRRVVGCRLFHFPSLFTHAIDRLWDPCLMLQDKKILGTSRLGVSRHASTWSSFTSGKCQQGVHGVSKEFV